MKRKLEMNTMVTAFLGSSSTAGKGQAYDWIGELRQRAQTADFVFGTSGLAETLLLTLFSVYHKYSLAAPRL
jgi:hypothetical protein